MKTKSTKFRAILPYLLVFLSFALIILLGSLLLNLPCAQQSGEWGNYIDSLYIATSATCVTGYDCYPMGVINTLTLFGQIMIAIMIQIGGLGFVTIIFFIVTLFRKKISFKDRFLLSQAVNISSFHEVIIFVRKIIIFTFIIELIGFLIGLPAFFAIYENTGEAVWGSIFFTISSFNNAGFDLFGNSSLILNMPGGVSVLNNAPIWAYNYICIYAMILVIFGGIGYLTLMDVFSFKKKPKQWRAATKICLIMAGILIVLGFVILLLTDGIVAHGNGTLSALDAFVFSISSRTAGFATYDPYSLSVGGRIIVCLLMFIGGSPLGTASGVKTTTIFIIILSISSYFRARKVTAFKRYYSENTIVKAMAVFIMSITIILIGYFCIVMFESNNPICTGERAIFETISSFTTTGYTTSLTISLSVGSKITCILLMFLGRLGPMTIVSMFSNNMNVEEKTHYNYVEEDILIG